jgi:signal transduction histidine kinase
MASANRTGKSLGNWVGINTRSLRWQGVLVPLVFWVAWMLVRTLGLGQPISLMAAIVELALLAAGAALFANWVAISLERSEAEIRRRTEHLEALRNATMALTTELDLGNLLQRVVDLSRTLVAARYGVLTMLGPDGRSVERSFLSGVGAGHAGDVRRHADGRVDEAGLLATVARLQTPVRVAQVPPAAPVTEGAPAALAIQALLGVPIRSKVKVIGNLYLADKRQGLASGGAVVVPFDREDQEILEMFAAQVAIAIENAQLYHENQQLAVLQERERIGMDLHDGVIQSIYAIGLLLDDAGHRLHQEPDKAQRVIQTAIGGLNSVIKDIRNYIQDLRPQRFQGRDVKQGLELLARELRQDTLYQVALDVDSQAAAACTARQADEFLHIAQEALANARKHAGGTAIAIRFRFSEGLLQLAIQDNGVGMDSGRSRNAHGNGLRNMRERARSLRGEFRIDTMAGRGTQIAVTAPIEKRE